MDPKKIWEHFRKTVTDHYFDLSGRMSRPDFWYFVLAGFCVELLAAIVARILFLPPVQALVGLALLLPMAGAGARRLQDAGQNGQLVWALLIPSIIVQLFTLMTWGPFGIYGFFAFYLTIGWLLNLIALIALVVMIYFWVQPGTSGSNAYGAPPRSEF
jgi:uncharacterized membrane protein YhaH (DUF805 family)